MNTSTIPPEAIRRIVISYCSYSRHSECQSSLAMDLEMWKILTITFATLFGVSVIFIICIIAWLHLPGDTPCLEEQSHCKLLEAKIAKLQRCEAKDRLNKAFIEELFTGVTCPVETYGHWSKRPFWKEMISQEPPRICRALTPMGERMVIVPRLPSNNRENDNPTVNPNPPTYRESNPPSWGYSTWESPNRQNSPTYREPNPSPGMNST